MAVVIGVSQLEPEMDNHQTLQPNDLKDKISEQRPATKGPPLAVNSCTQDQTNSISDLGPSECFDQLSQVISRTLVEGFPATSTVDGRPPKSNTGELTPESYISSKSQDQISLQTLRKLVNNKPGKILSRGSSAASLPIPGNKRANDVDEFVMDEKPLLNKQKVQK